MEEEKWNNLKRLELEKIELLNDAKRNLDVLKQQNKDILKNPQKMRVFLLYFEL